MSKKPETVVNLNKGIEHVKNGFKTIKKRAFSLFPQKQKSTCHNLPPWPRPSTFSPIPPPPPPKEASSQQLWAMTGQAIPVSGFIDLKPSREEELLKEIEQLKEELSEVEQENEKLEEALFIEEENKTDDLTPIASG